MNSIDKSSFPEISKKESYSGGTLSLRSYVIATCVALTVLAAFALMLASYAHAKVGCLNAIEEIVKNPTYLFSFPLFITASLAGTIATLAFYKIAPKSIQSTMPLKTAQHSENNVISSSVISITAPAPGKCLPYVKVGDVVSEESIICILEVMKMEITLRAGQKGKITEIHVSHNECIEAGAEIFRLEKI